MALDIKHELAALNARKYDFLESLPEEEAKTFNAYVFLRYASNPQTDPEVQEWILDRVNEFVNKDFWTLSKSHKGLQWKLFAATGTGSNLRFNYLAAGKKAKANKIEKLIAELNPAMKMDEVKLLASMMTKEDIKELFDSLGFDKKQRKEYE